jgi:hypothetical protein
MNLLRMIEYIRPLSAGVVSDCGVYILFNGWSVFLYWKDLLLMLPLVSVPVFFLVRNRRAVKRVPQREGLPAGVIHESPMPGELLPGVPKFTRFPDSGSEGKPESGDGTGERGADSWAPPAGNRRILADAIRSGSMVLFSYVDRQGRRTRRLVRPLAVYAYGGREYLRAFCTLREEERSFRLDRVQGLTISL